MSAYVYDLPPLVPERPAPESNFYSVSGLGIPRARLGPFAANQYCNIRRGVGTIDWYNAVPLPEHAQPRFFVNRRGEEIPNRYYRGEAWLLGREGPRPEGAAGAGVDTVRILPTRIEVACSTNEPDVLVINQNAHPGWRLAAEGPATLVEHEGLLAVKLPAAGNYTLSLRYVSRAFRRGLVLTCSGLLLLAVFMFFLLRGRPRFLTAAAAAGMSCAGLRAPVWLVTVFIAASAFLPLVGIGFGRWEALLACETGDKLLEQRRLDEAEAAFHRALAIEPGLPDAYLRLSLIALQRNQFDEAERLAEEALRRRPQYVGAQHVAAACMANRGRGDAALAMYREAARIDPLSSHLHVCIGDLLAEKNELEAAIEHYRIAIEAQPWVIETRHSMARALIAAGRADEAAGQLRAAWETRPDRENAAFKLAGMYASAGRYAEAKEVLHAHGAYSDYTPDEMALFARLLAAAPDAKVRDGRRALVLARELIAAEGEDSRRALEVLAAAHAEVGDFEKAVDTVRRALRIASDSADAPRRAELEACLALYEKGRPYRLLSGSSRR